MTRIDVIIGDELHDRLRQVIARKLGGKKGDLSKAVEVAIRKWVEENE